MQSKKNPKNNNLLRTSSGQLNLGYSNFNRGHTFSGDQTDSDSDSYSDEESVQGWLSETEDSDSDSYSDEESVQEWLSETEDSDPDSDSDEKSVQGSLSETEDSDQFEQTKLIQDQIKQISGILGELQSTTSSSPSQLDIHDLPKKITELFKKGQNVGKGTYGKVKKVKINGTYFAVKKAYHNNIQVQNSLWIKEKEIPYLLKIYHAITMKNGASYIIMEYLDEKEWMTLEKYREDHVGFSCRLICKKLKDAIREIHKSNFYLLDINPDNIMIKIHSDTSQNNIEVKFIDYSSSIYQFQNINEGYGMTYFYNLPDYREKNTNVDLNKQYAQDRDLFAIHIVCLFLTAYEGFFVPILESVDKDNMFSIVAKIFIEILYQNLLHLLRQYSTQRLKKQNISSQNYIDATFRIDTKSFSNIDENKMKTLLKQIFPSFYNEFKNSHFAEDRFDYHLLTK